MKSFAKMSFPIAAVLLLTGGVQLDRGYTAQVACSDLASTSWGGFQLDLVEDRAASEGVPAHCLIQGTIDTEIRFELLLPVPAAWNGRLVMGGGGGYVGNVQNQATGLSGQRTPLQQGFATVGTDTGHEGTGIDASWALERIDREVNYGYRAVHLTADAGKTIMRVHYGRDIDYSYFIGCSNGGRQGMMESQRFPDDFDGIVSGAPGYDWAGFSTLGAYIQQTMYPDPTELNEPVVTADARRLLSEAIGEACDERDGLSDGILNDPRDCGFRPEALPVCTSTQSGCLTAAQLLAIQSIYEGLSINGELEHPGFPLGGEMVPGAWERWITGQENLVGPGIPSTLYGFGTQFYKYLVFDDPDWDYASYDFANWLRDSEGASELVNATNADLTTFEVAGGKLLLWHGWSDAAITALGTIKYYERVRERHSDVASFVRLFMLPAVGHCGGGSGPSQVEWLETIQKWVEDDEAPDQVLATRRSPDGEVEISRPLCAFPARAVYDGSGDPRREDSFSCATP